MANTLAWNWLAFPFVQIKQNAKHGLYLTKEGATAEGSLSFGNEQLPSLFNTLAGSDINVMAEALVIYGDAEKTGDFPQAIQCANLKENGYGLSYEPWQLEKVKPTGFAMRLWFRKPQLWVFTNGFAMSAGSGRVAAVPNIKRIDANAKPEPTKAKASLQRREAKD
jgi:hypothetical protein